MTLTMWLHHRSTAISGYIFKMMHNNPGVFMEVSGMINAASKLGDLLREWNGSQARNRCRMKVGSVMVIFIAEEVDKVEKFLQR